MTWTLPDERAGHEAPADLVERRALVGGGDDQQVIADGVTADETEIGGVPCIVCAPASPDSRTRLLPRRRLPAGLCSRLAHLREPRSRPRTPGWCSSTTASRPSTRTPPHSRDTLAVFDALTGDGAHRVQRGATRPGGGIAAVAHGCVPPARRRGAREARAGLTVGRPHADRGNVRVARRDRRHVLEAVGRRRASALYLQGHDPRDPLASPQFADVTGFPPTQIFAGGMETLLDDSLELAARSSPAQAARSNSSSRPTSSTSTRTTRSTARPCARRARAIARFLTRNRDSRVDGLAPARERLGRFGARLGCGNRIGRRSELRRRPELSTRRRFARLAARRSVQVAADAPCGAHPRQRSTASGRNVDRISRPRATRRAPT